MDLSAGIDDSGLHLNIIVPGVLGTSTDVPRPTLMDPSRWGVSGAT